MAREHTNRLLQMIDDGLLDREQVILACVLYMSEAEVKDMMEHNEFMLETEDEENGEAS